MHLPASTGSVFSLQTILLTTDQWAVEAPKRRKSKGGIIRLEPRTSAITELIPSQFFFFWKVKVVIMIVGEKFAEFLFKRKHCFHFRKVGSRGQIRIGNLLSKSLSVRSIETFCMKLTDDNKGEKLLKVIWTFRKQSPCTTCYFQIITSANYRIKRLAKNERVAYFM